MKRKIAMLMMCLMLGGAASAYGAPQEIAVASYSSVPAPYASSWAEDSTGVELIDDLKFPTNGWSGGDVVGWNMDHDTGPSVTFELDSVGDAQVDEVSIYAMGGSYGFDSVTIFTAPAVDPNDWTQVAAYDSNTLGSGYSNEVAYRQDIPILSNAKRVRLDFVSADYAYDAAWTMLSEVEFYQMDPNYLVILDQPDDFLVSEGGQAAFSVEAIGKGAPLAYQWKKNGVDVVDDVRINGAMTATLTIDLVEVADEGVYTCVVSSSVNSGVSSVGATLDVLKVPALSAYGRRVIAHNPIIYWSFDETDGPAIDLVSKQLNRRLEAQIPTRVAHGDYGNGVAVTQDATTTVWYGAEAFGAGTYNGPFAIEMMVRRQSLAAVSNYLLETGGNNAPSVIQGYNNDPNSLFWYSGGNGIAGTGTIGDTDWHHLVFVDYDNNKLDAYLDGAKVVGFDYGADWGGNSYPDVGVYLNLDAPLALGGTVYYGAAAGFDFDELSYYDLSGLDETAIAQRGQALALHSDMDGPAYVTEQPVDTTAPPTTTAMLYCSAAGAEPISYQWKKGGVDLVDGGNISGAQTQVLTITNVQPGVDNGSYTCAVSNSEGGEESNPAILVVECFYTIPGDINNDCVVNLLDLGILAGNWLEDSSTP